MSLDVICWTWNCVIGPELSSTLLKQSYSVNIWVPQSNIELELLSSFKTLGLSVYMRNGCVNCRDVLSIG